MYPQARLKECALRDLIIIRYSQALNRYFFSSSESCSPCTLGLTNSPVGLEKSTHCSSLLDWRGTPGRSGKTLLIGELTVLLI